MVIGDGRMVKVICWYDNEWGYSNRCVELAGKVLPNGGAGAAPRSLASTRQASATPTSRAGASSSGSTSTSR